MNNPYRLAGLADLVGLLLDGWQVSRLHYADRCSLEGARDGAAAFVGLSRGDERDHLFLVDDGRTLSHRAVIRQFRDHPTVWKRTVAGPEELMGTIPEAPPQPAHEWGAVPEPFPDALELSPGNLRAVQPVQQVQCASGVSIALTCLERFTDGARLHFVCHAPHAAAWAEMTLGDVVAVDEDARMYRVAVGALTQHGTRFSGTLYVAPPPSAGTRHLTVTVGAFGRDADRVLGPWVFPIVIE